MDELWNRYIMQPCSKIKNDVGQFTSTIGYPGNTDAKALHDVAAVTSGVITFGGVNAVSCWIQGRFLGVSTGTMRPIPTLVGVATITVASYASHSAAIYCENFRRERQQRRKSIPDAMKYAWFHRPSIIDQHWHNDFSFFGSNAHDRYLHTIRVCVVGLLCFKLLGGRFWSVAPSSYTHVGSYARGSIVATDQYATPAQRQAIQRLGRIFGCHTCGTKPLPFLPMSTAVNFIGDHQPPKSVAYQLNQQWFRRLFGLKVPFRFYPHCSRCSNSQGGMLASASFELAKAKSWNRWFKNIASPNINIPSLRAAGGGRNAYFHGLQPRLHHLTGGIVAALATADNDQGRKRYSDLQSYMTKTFGRPYEAALRYCQQLCRSKSLQLFSNVRNDFITFEKKFLKVEIY